MRFRFSALVALLGFLWLPCAEAQAGMPTPVLSEWAQARFEAISFFGVVLLVAAAVVRRLWNSLAGDFSKLPRLSYGKALAAVVLWSMFFAVVLTMIAGARELLTPGAWQKEGLLYKVAEREPAPAAPQPEREQERKEAIERLKASLWHYAAQHGGHFPEQSEAEVAPTLWEVPGAAGMRYLYAAGLAVGDSPRVLAYEPDLFGGPRFVLLANGEIALLPTPELRRKLEGAKP